MIYLSLILLLFQECKVKQYRKSQQVLISKLGSFQIDYTFMKKHLLCSQRAPFGAGFAFGTSIILHFPENVNCNIQYMFV